MLVNIADFIALDLDPERMMYTPNAKPSRVTLRHHFFIFFHKW